MRPLIGITTSEVRPLTYAHGVPVDEPFRAEMALGITYTDALELAGAAPVVLPPLGEETIEGLLDALTPERVALAAEIAAIPEFIRGYGPVKERHLKDAKAREAALLEEWKDPSAAAKVRIPIRAAA